MITTPLADKRPPASNVSLLRKRLQRRASQTSSHFRARGLHSHPAETFAESQRGRLLVPFKRLSGESLLRFHVFVACECKKKSSEGTARAGLPWEDFLICGF